MHGRASALGAGTVLNALATGVGSAFAIDAETRASVELDDSGVVRGEVAEDPDADTRLVERCVERVVERFGNGEGGTVRTESDVPMAAGLKSSSAAANATVLATLSALGVDVVDDESEGAGTRRDATDANDSAVTRLDACRIGVEAARDAGVTVTGAFDDASASMLGGVTVTDNREDALLARDEVDWNVLVWTPPERAYSADADTDRCTRIASVAETVADLALAGRYAEAMTVNGFAFSAALGFSTDPAIEALPDATGVSLSGTGPSVVAVGDAEALERVREQWDERAGTTFSTETRTNGAHIHD
ncbi:shikimate kinase [Haloprofundus marisrubri]|uniref:Shikimate kinase n=1 Tax=Haloprofundus marisrubri TaxID=1514971 RepID=A0A0W1RA09_9EURY|nr:shikimate kinase [Haloprofundus marisrubri]KTG10361.1 shikimate kinase [Haloprofundus marisrubri]